MPVTRSEIRPGAYFDSVVLMQLQRALADLPGVLDAGVVMATPANRELLASNDLLVTSEAGSDDLLIVVRADDDSTAAHALEQVDVLLARRRSSISSEFRPRSLDAAIKRLPDAKWLLVSVPGRYAAAVAHEGLDRGLNIFLYSDNVPTEDEIALKNKAAAKNLLVMGPDCGTAIVNGIGLGFANRVRAGAIGLVGASGTGLQAITSYIHNTGGGISQAIGTGGRDLSAAIKGVTTLQALSILGNDTETKVIVLVSKPPEPQVATRILSIAELVGKPMVIAFIGFAPPARHMGNLHFASGLEDAAQIALDLSTTSPENIPTPTSQSVQQTLEGGYVRGLFSGGTLAYETLLALQAFLAPVYSNVPLREGQRLADVYQSQAHTILDLGDDQFTQGRLHPMMDNELRLRRLRHEASDPEVTLILLDVVLGEGAHLNPAEELAPAISEAKNKAAKQGRTLEFAAIVVGTDEDPQGKQGQIEQLEVSGAVVFSSPTEAVAYIGKRMARGNGIAASKLTLSSQEPVAAINIGVEMFYDSLMSQGAEAVQVDWRPPAGGNERLMAILDKMKST